ncbi:MAG: SLBB domain-containing protein [candidate division Zixibacteria bacterium]
MKISTIAIFILISFFLFGGLCLAQNPDNNSDLATRIGESIVNAQSKSVSFTEMALQMIYNSSQNKFLGNYVDPEDYIVGPGDRFTIFFISDQLANISCEIKSDGHLFIKSVGQIYIGPITMNEAVEKIKSSAGELFAGSPFTIQLTEFRFVKVNVSGQVKNPGTYYAPATWRISEIIELAGGITPDASIRNIVFRGNKGDWRTDLLRYNAIGDNSTNPLLCKGDFVFVPSRHTINRFVSLSGNVNQPGIIEIIEGDKLSDLIAYAGGLIGNSEDLEIVITSTDGEEKNRVDLASSNASSYIPAAGDNLNITWKQGHQRQGFVVIFGEVARPGRYGLSGDIFNLAELFNLCGGVTPKGIRELTQIYRLSWLDREQSINIASVDNYNPNSPQNDLKNITRLSLNPRDIMDPIRIILMDRDSVYVPEITGMISVLGAVASPGLIPHINGKDVDYYIVQAGGFGSNANRDKIIIINPSTGGRISIEDTNELFDGEIIYIPEKESQDKR